MQKTEFSCSSIVVAFQYIKGAYRKDGEVFIFRECSDRTGGKGFKLTEARLRSNTWRRFFTQRVMRHWNRLSRVAGQPHCGCPIPGGVQGWIGWGPGQPGLVGGNPAHSTVVELDIPTCL